MVELILEFRCVCRIFIYLILLSFFLKKLNSRFRDIEVKEVFFLKNYLGNKSKCVYVCVCMSVYIYMNFFRVKYGKTYIMD